MCNSGNHLAPARVRQLGKEQIREAPGHIGEGIAVEEKEGRAPMAAFEKLQRFQQGAL
jgi:hypothetical protein